MVERRVQRRLAAIVAADVVGYSRMMGQDETGTLERLKRLRTEFLHPKVAEYAGRTGAWRLEIVRRNDVPRFEVVPKRWIVERTFAWIARNRRLARDFERHVQSVVAFIRLAMIRIMLRRLAANRS